MTTKKWLWRYSVGVCRRPRLVIAACVVTTLACSLGLFRVQIITNPDLIWVPPNSLASRQKEFFDDAFDPFFRVNQVFFVAEGGAGPDMVSDRYLQRVMAIQRAIENAKVTNNAGEEKGFDSLCFKPIDGEGCLVESPSQYWLDDPIILAGDPSPSLTAACQTSDTFLESRSPCMDKIGTPVMRGVVFGDIGVNSEIDSPDPCGGSVPTAGALVLTFLLNNYQDAEYQELAERWEKEVFLSVVEEARVLLENDVQAPMKVSYMAQRSVADSLSVEAGENAWVLIVSYLCMFLYVSLVLGNPCHAVRSRFSLALTGITIVVASLATTIGVLSLLGVGTTLIVWEVVPFLTLAIGVDNMVILSREFDRLEGVPEFEACTSNADNGGNGSSEQYHNHHGNGGSNSHNNSSKGLVHLAGIGVTGPTYSWAESASSSSSLHGRGRGGGVVKGTTAESRLEDRMGSAVSKVAPSILGAAVCEAVAFLVGALTNIPALRQFCLVAATAVLVGFVLQVSWFMAALSLDARRVSQGRLDLRPWKTQAENSERYDPPKRDHARGTLRAPLLADYAPGGQRRRWQQQRRRQRTGGGRQGLPPSSPRSAYPLATVGGYADQGEDGDWVSSRYAEQDVGGESGGASINSRSSGRDSKSGHYRGWYASSPPRHRTDFYDPYDSDGGGAGQPQHQQHQQQHRSLMSEFGSGSDPNPALFSTPPAGRAAAASPPTGRKSGGAAARSSDKRSKLGSGGGGGSDGKKGGWTFDRRGRRGWFGSPISHDGDKEARDAPSLPAIRGDGTLAGREGGSMLTAATDAGSSSSSMNNNLNNSTSSIGSAGSRSRRSNNAGGGVRPEPREEERGARGRRGEARSRRSVLGGGVVEGYVSLDSELLHASVRRSSFSHDDYDNGSVEGLLLAPPGLEEEAEGLIAGTRGGGGGGLFCGGTAAAAAAGAGAGLSLFREQLYQEGRNGKGSLASRFLDRYYLPALFSRGGKILTLAMAAALALLGCFGLAGLQMGLEPQLAAPADFYLQDYYDAQFSKGEAGPPAYVVFSDVDYFRAFDDDDARAAFHGVSTGLAQLQKYVQAPIYSWFDTMVAWVNQKETLAADCPTQTDITDEASFYSMVELFLTIPIESQCCQSYGVCGAQFDSDVTFDEGEEDGIRRVIASRLRFNMQPLNTQRDFVNSYYYVKLVTDQLADEIPERYKGQRKANKAVGNLAFPYSLYFVFYEQYAFIQGVAVQNIALALAVVFLSIAVLARFSVATLVATLVLGTTLGTVGLVWAWGVLSSAPYAVSINAVSVCNLVMSLGLSVEFCLHVAMAFQRAHGTRQERAEAAMKSAGASVLTGITLTKLVGVSVLAIAPSLLFRVYYFRMYMATVAAGAFEGLAVLPVLLSMCGPKGTSASSRLPSRSNSYTWAEGDADSWGDEDEEVETYDDDHAEVSFVSPIHHRHHHYPHQQRQRQRQQRLLQQQLQLQREQQQQRQHQLLLRRQEQQQQQQEQRQKRQQQEQQRQQEQQEEQQQQQQVDSPTRSISSINQDDVHNEFGDGPASPEAAMGWNQEGHGGEGGDIGGNGGDLWGREEEQEDEEEDGEGGDLGLPLASHVQSPIL